MIREQPLALSLSSKQRKLNNNTYSWAPFKRFPAVAVDRLVNAATVDRDSKNNAMDKSLVMHKITVTPVTLVFQSICRLSYCLLFCQ